MNTEVWMERLKRLGFVAGPALAMVAFFLLPDTYRDASGNRVPLSPAAQRTIAVGIWMSVWWLTEAVHFAIPALLPAVLFPLLRVQTLDAVLTSYASKEIFLFAGGFLLSLSMERWGLHQRVAYGALRVVGRKPGNIVLGFMTLTAMISMWVSNTATALMMMPIALSLVELSKKGGRENPGFALSLMLGIAYGASIGGIGTPFGTPPNIILKNYVTNTLHREISVLDWMKFGVPLVAVFLPLTWLLLTRVLHRVGSEEIQTGDLFSRPLRETLGPWKRGEWVTLIVFLFAVTGWISLQYVQKAEILGRQPLLRLSDSLIAMIAGLSLFLIPVRLGRGEFVMDWKTAQKLPWDVLILFGGGLALAKGIETGGVGSYLASLLLPLQAVPLVLMILVLVAVMVFAGELASNTAMTATFVPILGGLAPGIGVDPFLLIVPATIAASCGFMLPVATPPNAIAYSSGHVPLQKMYRAGFWLDVISIVLVTGLTYLLIVPVLGIPLPGR